MLKLIDIKKDYVTGDTSVSALRGVSLEFRKSEFVAILGHSGCGKTTLLNIIGGLDKYTSGDLIINGKSTKDFKDSDWDSYRNHSIGFVFQSYNLIPHQSVLANVELALTLSGVSREERKKRATEALQRVGLGDQLNKKPNQMSGGQMQRVAIARALVNNPDILLADEPTGALDTDTSVQIMELIKEISKDKLVIMVTHNPELADEYANRIIRLKDGVIEGDSNPYSAEVIVNTDAALAKTEASEDATDADLSKAKNKKKDKKQKQPKTSMSFLTAFLLSLNNLLTKKGRTILTAFAGSIGIIGIALIFAVSQGMTGYVNHVQETTLSSYPLTIESTSTDASALLEELMGTGNNEKVEHPDRIQDAIYKDQVIADLVEALSKVETSENDLKSFKAYLESELAKEDSELKDAITAIQYVYDISLPIYTTNADGTIIKSDVTELLTDMLADFMMQSAGKNEDNEDAQDSADSSSSLMASMLSVKLWQEMIPGLENGQIINPSIKEQYDLIYGEWANDYNEVVLIVNRNNELDDLTLYALGFLNESDINAIIDAATSGQVLPKDDRHWSYADICAKEYKVILPSECYNDFGTGLFYDASTNETFLAQLYEKAFNIKISGIIRLKDDVDTGMLSTGIGYTHLLTEHVIKQTENSAVVKAQKANPDIDVLTGLPFKSTSTTLSDEQKTAEFKEHVAKLSTEEKAQIYIQMMILDEIARSLDTRVDEQLNQYQTDEDRQMLINMISEGLAEEFDIDPAAIAKQFEGIELPKLKELLRPYIEEQVKAGIAMQIGQMFATTPADMLVASLDSTLSADGFNGAFYYDEILEFSDSSLEENLTTFGNIDLDKPYSINLYCETFEQKDLLKAFIDDYNTTVKNDGTPEKEIKYSDFVGLMMSSITKIINAITYVLIAFVATSLIVSSIMIGVITLISVQERTKEIGILRAMGASKKDISRVFNAETMIVGFTSGVLGILVTLFFVVIINIILNALTGIEALKATLGVAPALILIGISMLLTLIAGLIPSRVAAKKDPVIALRTE